VGAADRSMDAPLIEAVWFRAGADVPRDLARDIVARTSRRVSVPCHLHPETWNISPVRLGGREQADADSLLAVLEASAQPGCIEVGLTGIDMGLKLFTFVFGRATLNGRAAVVSLARLGPERYGLAADAELTARRTVAEVLHELGHVAGLAHCDDFGCLMHFATNVESIDLRGAGFCPACTAALPRQLLAEAQV